MKSMLTLLFAVLIFLGAGPISTHADDESPAASAIMEQPLDGGSEAAFRAGMDKVKAEATPTEFQNFNVAIGRLMTYDLSVRNDIGKLAEKLDGKTPLEVIEMAPKRR